MCVYIYIYIYIYMGGVRVCVYILTLYILTAIPTIKIKSIIITTDDDDDDDDDDDKQQNIYISQ